MAQRPSNYNRMSPEDKALWDYINEGENFKEGGAAQFNVGKALEYQNMDANSISQLQKSGMEGINTDPRLQNAQYDALRQLEEQSKTGFTARDEADLAKLQSDVNRQNKGRMGAIQQNMAARGMSGSGMDLVAQMQSSQDATDREALAALEKNAQMGERKDAAIMNRGQMSGQMRSQDFNEQAQKAQAQDAINRFNTANRVQSQFQNNQGQNQTAQNNWQRQNQTSDNNTSANYDFRKDSLGVGQNNAQMQYNKATEDYNRAQLRKQQREAKRKGQNAMIGSVVGGVGGFMVGGPMGAMAGSQAGGALGGSFAHGGMVPGKAPFEGIDDEENDIFAAQLSPGEIVIPKSIAHDPQASAKFVAAQNAGMDPMSSKYVAQDARMKGDLPQGSLLEKLGSKAPVKTAIGTPVKDLGEAPTQTVTAQPPISPKALEALAKTNPSLVEAYKARMAGADSQVKDAQSQQDMFGMANMAGKALNDYSNSQKTDVILKNRMQDLGRSPTIKEAERKEYDGSMLDKLGAQGVSRANENRALEESRFDKETNLGVMDKANAKEAEMNDPNSAESQSAREYLKQIAPSAANMPNFGSLSSAQIAKIAPGIYKSYADTKDNEMKKYGIDSSASTQRRGQDLDMTKAGWELSSREGIAGADRGSRERISGNELSTRERISDKDRASNESLNREKWTQTGGGSHKLPSVEQQKFNNNAAMGAKAIRDMRAALSNGDNTFSIIGDNDFTESQRRAAEAFGRIQSGGAINKDEEERFLAMGPNVFDSAEMQQKKLNKQQAEFDARLRAAGVDPEAAIEERGGSAAAKPSWAK